jgi:hypothetical protein
MAAAYLVTLPAEGGQTLINGVNALVVYADSDTAAKAAAAAAFNGDSKWTGATATAIVIGDYAGWTMRVKLYDPDVSVTVPALNVAVVGDATNNTIDEVAALMVTALNATALLTAAAYDSTTQVLTVVDASTDAYGDYILEVEFTHADFPNPVAELVGTIADEGTAGSSDVTVTLKAAAYGPPKLYGGFRTKG